MNRRDFSLAAASLWLLPSLPAGAGPGARARGGGEYLSLGKPAPVDARPARSKWSSSSRTLPALQRLRAPAGSLDQEAAADVVFRRVPVAFAATTSCPSSACSIRWKPWASSTSSTQGVPAPSTPSASRCSAMRRCWPGPKSSGLGRQEVCRTVQVVLGVRQGQARDATAKRRLPGRRRPCAGRGRPLVRGRRDWPATLDRALQITDYLISEARKG